MVSQKCELYWGGLLMFMAFALAAWNQMHWWNALEENHSGWLSPFFCTFVLWDRRIRLKSVWGDCKVFSSKARTCLIAAAVIGYYGGLFLLLIGCLHRLALGPTTRGTFLVSLGAGCVVVSLSGLTCPAPNAMAVVLTKRRDDPLLKLAALLAYPAFVWLISDPKVAELEMTASYHVLEPMAKFVAISFNTLGFPVGQQGNLILMPDGGHVGVEEACSGIRSFAACINASCFLGALYISGIGKKILLVLAATVAALLLNLMRSIFLTGWAFSQGTRSIDGKVHDIAGYTVMAVTIAVVIGLLPLFAHGPRRNLQHL